MPYENNPGGRVTYLDGAFKIPTVSGQDKILVVGPASSGSTNVVYNVGNVSVAEKEFGSATELMRVVHEAVAEGADNISVIRSGGKQGSWVFTDSASATLTITPEYRDDQIFDRYKLFIENDGTDNRYMVYDEIDQSWVYDSSDILVLDEGVVTVEDSGIDLFTLYDRTDIAAASLLSAVVVGDFTAAGSATASSVTTNASTDGTSVSRAERYAALESTYHLLDYEDADLVIPSDVYIDDKNAADDATATYNATTGTDGEKYGYYWKGVPSVGEAEDALGFVWQYRAKGSVYTYFTDVSDYFTGVAATPVAATLTLNGDLVFTAAKVGKGGNAITVEVIASGGATAGSEVVTVTETDHGFAVVVDVEAGVSTNTQAAAAITTALALPANALRNGVLPSTLLGVTGGATVIAAAIAVANLSGGTGGAVLTHAELTGETPPTVVTAAWAAGADAELRECNFAHQLASFCDVASTNWSTLVGMISFKEPTTGYSRNKIADWVGQLPTYKDDGVDIYIDSPSDNGSGILGNKFMAGFSKTSAGYRNAQVDNGNGTDGYAYGGLIKTVGASLPNGSDWPYGISDNDEALDSGGKPVDLGKHILVSYDWPIISNGYNGGTTYRGALPGVIAGKVVTMPENEEPIGANGSLLSTQRPTRVHGTQVSDLAGIRVIGTRRDINNTIILTTAKTAAHPDSDYTRLSTIRCVNRMLTGIRNLARPYIGKSFSSQRLASLQSAVDAFIVSERGAGIHQGAKARIEFSREDRIMGRLKIKLRMVPPFSIEFIDVETSLAADESEL